MINTPKTGKDVLQKNYEKLQKIEPNLDELEDLPKN